MPLRPSQVASDFHKEYGGVRLSAGAREAGGEGARSVSLGPRWEAEEKAPCQQPGPWAQARSSAPFCSAGF